MQSVGFTLGRFSAASAVLVLAGAGGWWFSTLVTPAPQQPRTAMIMPTGGDNHAAPPATRPVRIDVPPTTRSALDPLTRPSDFVAPLAEGIYRSEFIVINSGPLSVTMDRDNGMLRITHCTLRNDPGLAPARTIVDAAVARVAADERGVLTRFNITPDQAQRLAALPPVEYAQPPAAEKEKIRSLCLPLDSADEVSRPAARDALLAEVRDIGQRWLDSIEVARQERLERIKATLTSEQFDRLTSDTRQMYTLATQPVSRPAAALLIDRRSTPGYVLATQPVNPFAIDGIARTQSVLAAAAGLALFADTDFAGQRHITYVSRTLAIDNETVALLNYASSVSLRPADFTAEQRQKLAALAGGITLLPAHVADREKIEALYLEYEAAPVADRSRVETALLDTLRASAPKTAAEFHSATTRRAGEVKATLTPYQLRQIHGGYGPGGGGFGPGGGGFGPGRRFGGGGGGGGGQGGGGGGF